MSDEAKLMTIIPKGTLVSEPDVINRVTLMFRTADDAIIFYEAIVEMTSEREP